VCFIRQCAAIREESTLAENDVLLCTSTIYDKLVNRSQVRFAKKILMRNDRYFMELIKIW